MDKDVVQRRFCQLKALDLYILAGSQGPEHRLRIRADLQGQVLGTITLQHLIALYPKVCGMTGTAATQSVELRSVYGLEVETIRSGKKFWKMQGKAFVNDTLVAEGEIMAAVGQEGEIG